MQVKTIRASSVKEAMEQIKDELGSDAVLLHTKKYREGGVLGGVDMIEVTAAVDESQARTPRPASTYKPPTAPILPSSVLEQYRMNEALRQENAVAVPAGSVLPPEYDAYTPESTGVPAYPPTEAWFLTDLKPVRKKPPVKPSSKRTGSLPAASGLPVITEASDASLAARVAADISAGGEDTVAKRVHSLESELTQMKIMLASVMEKQQPKAFVSERHFADNTSVKIFARSWQEKFPSQMSISIAQIHVPQKCLQGILNKLCRSRMDLLRLRMGRVSSLLLEPQV